jgi:DNA-binding response OmpR family regulator
MLTAKGSVSDKEMGLDNGADDYMTKPFHLRELSARIRALLRRPPRERFSCLRAGEIELNPIAITVTKSGQASSLLPKEFILLATLLRNKDRIMTISDLLDQVWGQQSHVSPATLRSNIKSLRRKIDTAGKPSSIITLHGIGYKIGGSQTY